MLKYNCITLGFCFGILAELVFSGENGEAFLKKNDMIKFLLPKVLRLKLADKVGSDPIDLPDHKGHVISNPCGAT